MKRERILVLDGLHKKGLHLDLEEGIGSQRQGRRKTHSGSWEETGWQNV